jgi:hypothetical protein
MVGLISSVGFMGFIRLAKLLGWNNWFGSLLGWFLFNELIIWMVLLDGWFCLHGWFEYFD